MIGVDWGTSNFRAYRFAEDGGLTDRIEAGPGILAVPPGGFPGALRAAIGPWLAAGERRILLAGMVGSRQGWAEAAYLPCPANLIDLAAAALPVPFDGAEARILPGLVAEAAIPDVMRGEETQLFGCLDWTGPDALACLPGTHSKWARIQAGRITGFSTHMTGELFATLKAHTILGRLMTDAPPSPAAFAATAFFRGVARANQPGGLLHHLFGVRAQGLFGRLADADSAAYLSGLLIGHEVAAVAPAQPVHLIGDPSLCALYADAITQLGGRSRTAEPGAAARGLAGIGALVAWT